MRLRRHQQAPRPCRLMGMLWSSALLNARPGLHRGGWAGTLTSRQRDRHHAHHCASKSPLELQRCRVQHTICRGAEVPSSTHLPLSPVGIHQDAHRLDSRTPLGLEHRAAELPICIPMVCPITQTAGTDVSPHIPSPPGRADGSADCLSLHTLVHGRLTVGVKRHLQCELAVNTRGGGFFSLGQHDRPA